MFENVSVYVLTQYPSQANRRVVKVLQLHDQFERMTLVSEPGEQLHDDRIIVKKTRNPTAVLKLIGLKGLRRGIDERLYFPSPAVLYIRAAFKQLRNRIKADLDAGRRVCLLTMTPPHELTIIGLKIKREFPQVRWLLDWQDLWSYDEYYFGAIPEHNKTRTRQLEQQALQTCDINVVTNPGAKRVLEDIYQVHPGKVISIGHPFDYDELGDSPVNGNGARSGPIKVGILGHLFKLPKVPGDRVVAAFDQARSAGMDVELHVYGDMQSITAAAASNRAWMIVHPRLPHSESLRAIAKCDFLLLTLADLPNTQIIMHAKVAHYLILGRPILAMVPDQSFVACLVRETGTGHVISSENWGADLIRILEDQSSLSTLNRNEDVIKNYSWSKISGVWLQAIIGEQLSN